nr:immunoglobulin heavy chain junction region [Macaca mulatta]MOV56034.1 immunoglobulin heavy chain junction region [Macaca mulatta]MOV57064.1 immunoglobulin heavy chain junction region [Macaca mulatta]MOV58776.1 immunoglobulin heavy chain junction region [Macaca mulatta]MOV60346.1 immunoglobulin heavy chain junction region [Macaca mulatta]
CARVQSGFYGSGWFLYYIDYW